jgi:serine/threonine protein kinase
MAKIRISHKELPKTPPAVTLEWISRKVPMAQVLEQFVRNLRESRLLSPEEATSLEKALQGSKTAHSVDDVTKLLVKNGKLTDFQATAISQGQQQSLILGEYVLLDILGKGGMGIVFRARHRLMDRIVALKTLPAAKIKADSIQRFYREVKAAARLSHRNIVTAFDAGEQGGTHYLVMEYVQGRDLSAIVKEKGPLSLREAIDYTQQTARGLDFAHNHGVVHRDVKPSNLLLDREGVVKILDMGLARLSQDLVDNPDAAELTSTGQILGTVDYMSPEQAVDVRSADHLSDIYSLGCTLYYFLTRRPVYTGENIVQRILAHRESPIPSVTENRPDCPPPLDALIGRMLAKRPSDRPQSMAEVITALDHCISNPGDAPPPVTAAAEQSGPPQSSWLEDLVSTEAAPTTEDSQIHETTLDSQHVLHAPPQSPRAGGSVTRQSKITRQSNIRKIAAASRGSKRWKLIGGLAALLLVAASAAGLLLTPAGRGLWSAHNGSAVEPGKNSGIAAPEDSKAADSGKPAPVPRSDWEVAWSETKARADRLLADRAYEKAIREYSTLGGRFKDPPARQRCNDTIHRIEADADAAYAEVEKTARNFLRQQQWAQGRAVLKSALSKYGWVPATSRVKKLLEKFDEAEKASTPVAVKPVKPVERPVPASLSPELLRQRQLDEKYVDALGGVESRVAAWEFQGAARDAGRIHFDAPELAARLTRRREEIGRMADLKERMIADINQANPPLQKIDLALRGFNGDISRADTEGITAALANGKRETLAWPELGAKALAKLLARVVHREDAGDWLVAGLLSLEAQDVATAERYFEKARSLGADTAAYRGLLAGRDLAAIQDLLGKHQYAQSEALLTALAEKYGKLPWFAANRLELDAASKEAKRGLREKDAEALYIQAAGLFRDGSLIELKPVVARFKTQYADSAVAADLQRNPSVAEMETAVAGIGPIVRVRKDGQGDFKSIQEAINKSLPNTVIQIEESGPWGEQIMVPASKENLTICGKKGILPVITTAGAQNSYAENLLVNAAQLSLERVVIVRDAAAGQLGTAIAAEKAAVSVRGSIVHGHMRVNKLDSRQSVFAASVRSQGAIDAKDSAFFGQVFSRTSSTMQNVLVVGNANCGLDSSLRHCTITGHLQLAGKVIDSIVSGITAINDGQTIEYCNVYGENPYLQKAAAGKGCFSKRPLFADLKELDFRLQTDSPCRKAASDGGDLGFSPPANVQALLRMEADLRNRAREKR